MAKKSNAAKIRAYITANPDAKPADIAAKFKVSPTYVYVIRSQMKKQVREVTPTGRKFKWADVTAAVINHNKKNEAQAEEYETLGVFSSGKSIEGLIASTTKALDMQTADMVNHPPHYKTGGIETIDFIEAKGLNYRLGNVVKYITRADHKGDRLENLKKAQWYLEREITREIANG
jgi:hypothetical protein